MPRYNDPGQRQQEQPFTHGPSSEIVQQPYTPSAQVAHRRLEQGLPAMPTLRELEVMEAENVANVGIQGVGNLVREIAEQQPNDPGTYREMLEIKAEFVEEVKFQIHGGRRRW